MPLSANFVGLSLGYPQWLVFLAAQLFLSIWPNFIYNPAGDYATVRLVIIIIALLPLLELTICPAQMHWLASRVIFYVPCNSTRLYCLIHWLTGWLTDCNWVTSNGAGTCFLVSMWKLKYIFHRFRSSALRFHWGIHYTTHHHHKITPVCPCPCAKTQPSLIPGGSVNIGGS